MKKLCDSGREVAREGLAIWEISRDSNRKTFILNLRGMIGR
jgi:hypothetical protein